MKEITNLSNKCVEAFFERIDVLKGVFFKEIGELVNDTAVSTIID